MKRTYTLKQILEALYDVAAEDVCIGLRQDSVCYAASLIAQDLDHNSDLANQIITVED